MAVTNPYAAVEDVQSYLNSLGGPGITIAADSIPSTAEVEGWLDQVSAEVDNILKVRGYGTVPATGSSDILLLKRFICTKVAAMVFEAAFMSDELPEKVRNWNNTYETFIGRLLEDKYRLINQSPTARVGSVFTTAYIEDL